MKDFGGIIEIQKYINPSIQENYINRIEDISLKKLKKLYIEEDKTTYEIADIFGCERRTISKRLKKYGIDIKRHKRKYSFYYKQKLNKKQDELIVGSILGDACICRHHEGINSCRFLENHSIKQLEYLKWKKNILNNFVSQDIYIYDNSKNNSYGDGLGCSLTTVLHKEFIKYREKFYKEDKKKIPEDFELSTLSLFTWFCDDGSVHKNGRLSYIGAFHTEGYSKEEVEILRNKLFEIFDIDTFVIKSRKKYFVIRLNGKNYKKLCGIIKKYIIPSMSYKIKF